MKELRIGLVLYGGVALAVYINGVTTEIWHALRASQARKPKPAQAGVPATPPLDTTATVYCDLMNALARRDDADDIRVVVDSVAGTSAGGVNGAALFKAVVEGADARVLNGVWLDDADISNLKGNPDPAPWYLRSADCLLGLSGKIKLLKEEVQNKYHLDWGWLRDTVCTLISTDDPRKTPLKGDFFTRIIAGSLLKMSQRGTGTRLLPDRGTFDLFLTRTDLHGWPRHLPVSERYHPTDLYERTHAHVIAFSIRPGPDGMPPERSGELDFDLTYAARTTAGFPVAFAPTTYDDVAREFGTARPGEALPDANTFADRYLREHVLRGFPTDRARMVDGGFLDNRPFTYVTHAIENKPADHEVRRIVAYIEPDPEREVDQPPDHSPGLLELAGNAFRLFRHEPILGDLAELEKRNAAVERILAFREACGPAVEPYIAKIESGMGAVLSAQDLEKWRNEANQDLNIRPLSGYLGYVAIKLRRAADVYAEILCRALNLPYPSRQAYAARRIVRAWLSEYRNGGGTAENVLDPVRTDGGGALTGMQLRLLAAFDVPFRLRRIRALVKVANAHYAGAAAPEKLDNFKSALADVVFRYEKALETPGADLSAIKGILGETGVDALIKALDTNSVALIDRHRGMLENIFEAVSGRFAGVGADENEKIAEAILLLPDTARKAAAHELIAFPYYDVMLYPLLDLAGIIDPIRVETLRISPYDARLVGDRTKPLPSAGLGAFQGFLDRTLRETDLLYGRLNGAERMIEMIVNTMAIHPDAADMRKLRIDYTLRAMEVILADAESTKNCGIGTEIATLRKKLNDEKTKAAAPSV